MVVDRAVGLLVRHWCVSFVRHGLFSLLWKGQPEQQNRSKYEILAGEGRQTYESVANFGDALGASMLRGDVMTTWVAASRTELEPKFSVTISVSFVTKDDNPKGCIKLRLLSCSSRTPSDVEHAVTASLSSSLAEQTEAARRRLVKPSTHCPYCSIKACPSLTTGGVSEGKRLVLVIGCFARWCRARLRRTGDIGRLMECPRRDDARAAAAHHVKDVKFR